MSDSVSDNDTLIWICDGAAKRNIILLVCYYYNPCSKDPLGTIAFLQPSEFIRFLRLLVSMHTIRNNSCTRYLNSSKPILYIEYNILS